MIDYDALIERAMRLTRTTDPDWNLRWILVAAYLDWRRAKYQG